METGSAPIILIRDYFKKAFKDIDLRNVILSLKKSLHLKSELYNELYLLQGKYTKFSEDQNKWKILSRQEADLAYNRIHHSIIQLIDAINLEDLNTTPSAFDDETLAATFPKVTIPTEKKNVQRKGVILYKIPDVMPANVAQKCIVRIAFYEEDLGENPAAVNTNITKEQIRIAKTMKVSLSSVKQDSFSFNHRSDKQYLEQQDYTEWVIYATPQTAGPQKLLLQTSTYKKIEDEVVCKDFMVAEKEIIVAEKGVGKDNNDIGTREQTEQEADNLYKKPKFSWNFFSKKNAPPLIAAMLGIGFELSGKTVLVPSTFLPPLTPSPDYDFSLDANPDPDATSIIDKLKEAIKDTFGSYKMAATSMVGGYLLAEIIIFLLSPPNLSLSYNHQRYPDSLSVSIKGDRPPLKFDIENKHEETLFNTVFYEKEVTKNIAYKDLVLENKDTLLFHLEDIGNAYVPFFEKYIGRFDYLSKFDTLQKDTLFNPFVEIGYKAIRGTDSLKLIANGSHAPFTVYLKGHRDTSFFDTLQFIRPDSQVFDFRQLRIGQGDTIAFHIHDNIGLKDTASLYSFMDMDYSPISADSLRLYITGTHPPFDLAITNSAQNKILFKRQYADNGKPIINLNSFKNKNQEPSIPLTFQVSNQLNLSHSFPFDYIPVYINNTPGPIPTLSCSFKQNSKILTLTLAGGLSVDQIFIKHKSTNKSITTFKRKNIDTSRVLLYLTHPNFKPGSTYIVEVIDSTGKSHPCNDIYIPLPPPPTCQLSPITCNFIKSKNKLQVKVQGNCPPFRIFINGNRQAALTKSGDYFKNYSKNSCDLINGQELNIRVEDSNGLIQSCIQTIGDSCYLKPNTLPFKGFDCIEMDNLGNRCAIVYLYRKKTRNHWKMRNQTFNDCDLVCKIKNEGYDFYEMDIDVMSPSCSKAHFTNLGDVTTFIYNRDASDNNRIDGYISPNDLINHIALACPKIVDPLPPTMLAFSAKPDTTYKYEGGFTEKNLKITQILEQKHRVQIYSLPKEKDSEGKEIGNRFHGELTSLVKLKLGYDIFIRHDENNWYIFLGGFKDDNSTEAKKFLKQLKDNKELEKFLDKDDKGEKYINSIFFKQI